MWKRCLTALIGLVSLSSHAIAHTHHHRAHAHDARIRPSVHRYERRTAGSPPIRAIDRTDRKTWIDQIALQPAGRRTEMLCLALGMYQEARSLPTKDQVAVGHVILNRTKESGDTVCQTLWEGHGSQFQWTRRPVSALIPREKNAWTQVQLNAWRLMTLRLPDITHGATLFYNPKLASPNWAYAGVRTARLGHVFIKPRS